jgi:hypothetical protein
MHVRALAQKRTHAQKFTHARAQAHIPTLPTYTRRQGGRDVVAPRAFRRRETPLFEATWEEHAAAVEALLTHGADVNAKNKNGCVLPAFCFLAHRCGGTPVVRMHGCICL